MVHEHRFAVMGTTAHISIVGGGRKHLDWAQARLGALEQLWSRFRSDSELSMLHGAAGAPCIVSQETYDLIEDAIDAWRLSRGVFDPTIGTTMRAAGYDRPFDELAREQTISGRHLPAPGPDGIVLHPYGPAVHLPDDVRLDLGGLAKGAAADLVARELLAPAHGPDAADDDGEAPVTGCMVNVGGDIVAAGQPPRPDGWRVSIPTSLVPSTAGQAPLVVSLIRGAVCTSTTIKRRWSGPDGEEHHLRDAGTGAPLNRGISTVTVIAARGAQAEVLTKMAMAAGPDGVAAVLTAAEATGVVVLSDGTVVHMPGLSPFIVETCRSEPGADPHSVGEDR